MATPYDLEKERCQCLTPFHRAPKFPGLSQWQLCWGCRGLSFTLDFKWPIKYAFVCMMSFAYLVLLMSVYCLYNILFEMPCWLLKAFPNCHCVCHKTTNMYVPISTFGGSNHGSLVFIRFGYPVVNSPTHSPKSLDHFLLNENDRPCRLDQRNVHYITSWEV